MREVIESSGGGMTRKPPVCEHKFCPEGGILSAAGMETGAITGLLHMLLKPLAALMLAGGTLFLARDVAVGPGLTVAGGATYLVVAACTALVWSGRELSLGTLRWLELLMFGAVATKVLFMKHASLVAAAATGDPGMVLSQWNLTALAFVLLMAAYAIFIPNHPLRTAMVVVPLAVAPFVLGLFVRVFDPEVAAMAAPTLGAAAISELGLMLGIGAAMSMLGSMLITRHRSMAFQAHEANLYDLREQIGKGGMGEVWLAEHQTLARPAAIKIIRPEILGNGDPAGARTAVRRFEREARATAALRSPNTVAIYDFGVTGSGVFYYVMEYLDGLDLDTLVKSHGPLDPGRAIHLLVQACASLGEAHAKGLIHRDIKPANLFTCRLGGEHDFVKVLDFGLVKAHRPDEELTQLTVDGLTTGTPAFMPPELAMQREEVGPATDIYALGCVAYWLVTGKLVFDQPTPMAMVVDHVKTVPEAPSKRSELAIPPQLDAVILRCLEKDPAARFGSMRELADALRAVPVASPWGDGQAEEWWNLHRPAAEALPKAS